MKSRTAMTYAVSAATVVTLALVGCSGGDDDPTAGPTPTSASSSPTASSAAPSPSVTASPTASASASIDIPAAARANTDAGAIAFTTYFFDEVNAAYMGPDATIIPALSTQECKSCKSLQSTVEQYVARGHRMQTTPTAPLTGLKMRSPLPVERVMVQFTLTQNAANVVDKSGKSVDKQSRGQRSQIAVLVWREGRWFMNGLAAA